MLIKFPLIVKVFLVKQSIDFSGILIRFQLILDGNYISIDLKLNFKQISIDFNGILVR